MTHPLVVNVRTDAWDVYIGRGRCPCETRRRLAREARSCPHGPTGWGNPFTVEEHGPDAMRLYVEDLARRLRTQPAFCRSLDLLAGKRLGCWCAPHGCHGVPLALVANAPRAERLPGLEAFLAGLPPRVVRVAVDTVGPHLCHAKGCTVPVAPHFLMCPSHWRRVPRDLQARVYATYRPGQEVSKDPTREYVTAAQAAIAAVARLEDSRAR